jgi:phage recombination protein Bet
MNEIEVIKDLDDRHKLIKNTIAKDLSMDEFLVFINVAKARGLDPLMNQIHGVKRSGKMVIQVGIDGHRAIAERTGKYAGSDEPVYEYKENKLVKATTTVYKMVQGQRCPFTASAKWDEYAPSGTQAFMYNKMPETMLGKCSEVKALRKAFPSLLEGLYEPAEFAHEVATEREAKLKTIADRFNQETAPEKPQYKEAEQVNDEV